VKDLEIDSLLDLIRYYQTQLVQLGVKVKAGVEVGLSEIEAHKPDVIILATGGLPGILDISGIDHRKVISTSELKKKLRFFVKTLGPKILERLTKWWMPIGKKVIVIGGAVQGCQLAEFLVKRGRQVTIVDTAEELGEGMTGDDKGQLFAWLKQKGATSFNKVRYERITDKGLEIISKEGERKTLEADTIILALPFQPNTELWKRLQGRSPEIYTIGDCKEPHLMVQAIADGWEIGRTI
jgi:pyruvate/2-oxoglutarate dehydrogenase complex dihydrolipoamide dehydrogenase (E3) component